MNSTGLGTRERERVGSYCGRQIFGLNVRLLQRKT